MAIGFAEWQSSRFPCSVSLVRAGSPVICSITSILALGAFAFVDEPASCSDVLDLTVVGAEVAAVVDALGVLVLLVLLFDCLGVLVLLFKLLTVNSSVATANAPYLFWYLILFSSGSLGSLLILFLNSYREIRLVFSLRRSSSRCDMNSQMIMINKCEL